MSIFRGLVALVRPLFGVGGRDGEFSFLAILMDRGDGILFAYSIIVGGILNAWSRARRCTSSCVVSRERRSSA